MKIKRKEIIILVFGIVAFIVFLYFMYGKSSPDNLHKVQSSPDNSQQKVQSSSDNSQQKVQSSPDNSQQKVQSSSDNLQQKIQQCKQECATKYNENSSRDFFNSAVCISTCNSLVDFSNIEK